MQRVASFGGGLLVAAAMVSSQAAHAQVGVPPEKSPFRDIENRMQVTLLSGLFIGGKDPVGVAPQSGPYFGARYDFAIGSLIGVTGRAAMVASKRLLLDPEADEGARVIGEPRTMVMLGDVGLTMAITGGRSFHGFAPYLSAGLGLATDLELPDRGGYNLSPRFMYNLGGGVRWLHGPNWEVRADAVTYSYNVKYPASYYLASAGQEPIWDGPQSASTKNLALTLGLSYRFYR